jgi:hypothetical protein
MARKRKPPGKSPPGKIPPPVCKAILLCDTILADPFTGKASVVGIFDRFFVQSFPGMTAPFFAYVQVTSGIGRCEITVEVRNVELDQNIAVAKVAEMNFKDRAAKAFLVITVPPLPLPQAGEYDFIVLADGQEIDRQQFIATTKPEKTNAADSTETPEKPD